MTSSTKPPVKEARKFNFGTDFEVENERMRLEMQRQQELEQQEQEEKEAYIPPPSFSEEELQQARDVAFSQGLEQGRKEMADSVETALIEVIERSLQRMETLLNGEQQRLEMVKKIALKTTIATIKKVWPSILQQLGLSLIEDTLSQSMEYNNDEPRIVVRVHDSLLDAVIQRLPQIQEQQAFAGKVIILSDSSVIAGDCKIEWADGGLERVSRTISQQLDAALERLLSVYSNSQNTDSERNES